MKRFINVILPLVLTLCLMAGCGGQSGMHSRLAAVDSIVDSHYDSALVVLAELDSLPMRRADRMYLELLRGKAMNKAGVPFTTDSVMRRVVRYYDRHGSANRRMLAHYVLGCAYRDMKSAPRALEEYQKAVSLADTARADCDLSTLMRVHSQMAELYMQLRLLEQEKREEKQAMELAYRMGDTLSGLILEEALCNILYNAQDYDACISLFQKLYGRYCSHGYTDNAALSCILPVKCFLDTEDFVQAKHFLDIYASCSFFRSDPRRVNGGLGQLHAYEGKYYLGIAEPDSAITAFRKALPYCGQKNNALLVYRGMAQAYGMQHQSDSVLKYTALYSDAKEAGYQESIGRSAIQMAKLYDYGVEQRIAAEQSKRAAYWKLWSCILVFSLISAALVTALHFRKKKLYTRHILHELKQKLAEIDALKAREVDPEVLKMKDAEIDALKTKEAESAEDILLRDERIMKLTGQVEFLCYELKRDDSNRSDIPLSQTDIVRWFKELPVAEQKYIRKEEWDRLSDAVTESCPAIHALIGGRTKLNLNEYRLCMLVLCGFEPFQIDDILGMKHSYSSKTRMRLHQKVFGTPGKAADFDRKLRLLL